MAQITCVYFIPIEDEGEVIEKAVPISLTPQDGADLSKLPREARETLSAGTWNGFRNVLPHEGPLFLDALLRRSNGYPPANYRTELTPGTTKH